jgi:hypothetical protein
MSLRTGLGVLKLISEKKNSTSNKHLKMNKAVLLSEQKIKEQLVAGIYLFASRAYGTASEQRQSDYDIILVLNSHAFDRHDVFKWKTSNWLVEHHWINPNFRELFTDESDRTRFVDFGDREAQVWMFNVETFQKVLTTNTMFAIKCIFLPEEIKWIEKRNFSEESRVNDNMLRQSVRNHSRSHLFMACKIMTQRLFPTENDDIETQNAIEKMSKDPIWNHVLIPNNYNFYTTKKLIWHSIRLLYFGINVKHFGRLTDYTEANYLYEDLIVFESHKWIDFRDKYIPIYNELTNEFVNLTRDPSMPTDIIEL